MSSLLRSGYALLVAIAFVLLSGCAATVQRPTTDDGAKQAPVGATAPLVTPLVVPAGSLKKLVLVFQPTGTFQKDSGWTDFAKEWSDIFKEQFKAKGVEVVSQETAPAASAQVGTVLTMNVKDYRNLRPGMKIMFGILVGNAFINASGEFRDLATGTVYGTRVYDTSGSVWQGIFASTTPSQMYAIADQAIKDLDIK